MTRIRNQSDKPIRLVLDTEVFGWNPWRGIPRVYREILSRVGRMDSGLEVVLSVQGPGPFHFPNPDNFKKVRLPSVPSGLRPWRLWSRLGPFVNLRLAARYWRGHRADVYHATHYRLPSSWSPSFCLVHDMIPELFPDSLPPGEARRIARFKRMAVRRATIVLCASENTKKDIVRILHVPSQKCRVVPYGGFSPELLTSDSAEASPSRRPFLLYVGGYRAPYKNFDFLLDALGTPDFVTAFDHDLVVVGPEAPTAREREKVRQKVGPREVRFVPDASDSDLLNFYRTCAAVVVPSRYEGFGLPVAEALSCGAPVVCSRAASLPEVGGSATCYFDPDSPASLYEALRCALSEGRRPDAVDRRRRQAARFSWDRTAEEFIRAARDTALKNRQPA